MYSFNGLVTLPAGKAMTGSELIAAALLARVYDAPQAELDAIARFQNAVGELIVVPSADCMTGDCFRRTTNGVCDANFVAADLTSTIKAGAAKKISPCSLGGRAFYIAAGGTLDFEFTMGNLTGGGMY